MSETEAEPEATSVETDSRLATDALARYLQYGVLVLLLLVALVGVAGLYQNVNRVIDLWVTDEFQPVFHAVFNLVVILLSAIGISVLVRRLTGE